MLRVIVLLVAGAILMALFVNAGGSNSGDQAGRRPSPSAPHEATGCSASKRAVTARLKAPSTAQFSDCYSTTADGVQTVTLTVDSQNGFGAMIRSKWVTKVRNNQVEQVGQYQ